MDEINSNDLSKNNTLNTPQNDYSNYPSQNETDNFQNLESIDNHKKKSTVFIPSGPVSNVTLLHKIINEENRQKINNNYLYDAPDDLEQVPYKSMKKSLNHERENSSKQPNLSDENKNTKTIENKQTQTFENKNKQTQQSEYEYKIKILKSYKKSIRNYLTEFCEENFIEEYQRQNLEAMVFAAFDGAVYLTDESIPASEISLYEDYKAF